ALDQLDRELTGVEGLLHVVVLDVRDHPYVARVLAERMTGRLPDVRTLPVALARILLGHAHRVEIEDVLLTGEPEDRLVTPREAPAAMQPVLEVPDDPVPQAEAFLLEERVEEGVEREHLAAVDV